MHNIVRQIQALESEIVEIKWTCKDGTIFYQRINIPPKVTRDSHMMNVEFKNGMGT